jgi:hypothetical protein
MSKRYKDKGRTPPWVSIIRQTMKSEAWRALSVGARATFLELKKNYNTNVQNAVFLSARDGAKNLGVSKNTVGKWLHELEHYGFVAKVQGAHLGISGVGKAARYRITDCNYASKPPTLEFESWDGVLYEAKKQKPVPKTGTHRPKNLDISKKAGTDENGNKRTKNRDIRTVGKGTKNGDIYSLTISQAREAQAAVRKHLRGVGLSFGRISEVCSAFLMSAKLGAAGTVVALAGADVGELVRLGLMDRDGDETTVTPLGRQFYLTTPTEWTTPTIVEMPFTPPLRRLYDELECAA